MVSIKSLLWLAIWVQLIGAGALSVALAEIGSEPAPYIDLIPLLLLLGAGAAALLNRFIPQR